MAGLTTHILDVAHGHPADNVRVELYRIEGERRTKLSERRTNADGRTEQPMLAPEETHRGTYELAFHIGAYFARRPGSAEQSVPDSLPFLDVVPVRFAIADTQRHYHVPLLAAPWSYTTYRGS